VVAGGVYLLHQFERLRNRVHRLEFEPPLREVMTICVELGREFFAEALNLPDDEIDNPEMVRAIWLRLQIWKEHYTGDIAFHVRFGEEPLKRASISEFPTTSFQFPLELATYPLFGKEFEQRNPSDSGANSAEKLVVLLSHKAIIIRARDGCFAGGVSSGHSYQPSTSDLVIPIREDDLHEYIDNFGHDDPDFLMMAGSVRRYERSGRWASWSITALFPEVLSFTTAHLDKSTVKPND
jgi:hypothetical protein